MNKFRACANEFKRVRVKIKYDCDSMHQIMLSKNKREEITFICIHKNIFNYYKSLYH